jgi:predicted permease
MPLERWLYSIRLRLRSLFRRRQVERELDEELRYHVERQAAEHMAAGLSAAEARYKALRALRGIEQRKEECRDAWHVRFLDQLLQDLRYGARALRQTRGLTAAAVASLALGIGANTAIFSLVDAVMLKLLPVRGPEQLMLLEWTAAGFPAPFADDLEGDSARHQGRLTGLVFSAADFARLQARNDVFSDTLAFASNYRNVNVGVNGRAEDVLAQAVSGNYFQALGVSPSLGRAILPSDDSPAAPPVVMVSHAFWQRQLAGDAAAAGKILMVNGAPAVVAGVAPPEFSGLRPGTAPDLWLPLAVHVAQYLRESDYDLRDPRVWWLTIAGRLKPGKTQAQARAQLAVLFDQGLSGKTAAPAAAAGTAALGAAAPAAAFHVVPPRGRAAFGAAAAGHMPRAAAAGPSRPAAAAGPSPPAATPGHSPPAAASGGDRDPRRPALGVVSLKRGLDDLRKELSRPLLLLLAMVGLVLAIACANVAGLLLARSAAREAEIALRASLGAARVRIVRQLLTESALLALLGGAAGLLVARWAGSALAALLAGGRRPVNVGAHLDLRVLAFTAAVALACGLLFGLAPALRASRPRIRPILQRTAPGAGGRGHGAFLAGKLLVGGQVALSLLLLIGAGLFLGTLERLLAVNLGFDRGRLVVFNVQPGLNGYRDERLTGYYRELERRIAAIPGVRAVGCSQLGPVGSGYSKGMAAAPGYTPPGERVEFYRHRVDEGYFAALGLTALQGRLIGPQDVRGAPTVVVVNERLVREFFGRDNPLGHRFDMGTDQQNQAIVVGVVRDVKYNEIRDEAPPTAYLSFLQTVHYPTSMTFEVRTAGGPGAVRGEINRAALAVDRNVPLARLRTEAEVVDQALFLERAFALLSSSFGSLALLLACVGLYGTIGYTVARRTQEIGVRMALGARRTAILAMVLRETLLVVFCGIAIGLPAAWLATRLLASRLFGLSAHDPATLALATGAIVAAAVIAGLLPARRAAEVDPMVALRCD